MASDFDFRGGKSRIVTILFYVKSNKALLVKRHPPTELIYVKIMVSSCAVRELYRLKKKKKKMEKS